MTSVVAIDRDLCDLDYSTYKKTHNVDDIGWMCDGVKYKSYFDIPDDVPQSPSTSSTSESKCNFWNQSDWACQSTGSKVGTVVMAGLVLAFVLWVIWGMINAPRKGSANARGSSSASSDRAMREYEQKLREKEQQLRILENFETMIDETSETSFIADSGEEVILVMNGVSLVETKKTGSTFKGGSAGLSYRLTKRVSVRTGTFQGQSIPGVDIPAIVDTGQFVVTTQRAVFTGSKQSREFDFKNLLSLSRQEIGRDHSVLYLPTSNRKTVSGIGTGEGSLDIIQSRLTIALGLKRGSKDQMIAGLRNEIENMKMTPPQTTIEQILPSE